MKKVMKDIFSKVNVQYPEKVQKLHNYLVFLSEKMKIEKFEKLIANLHDKSEYVIHIRINDGMVLGGKNHRVIKFNQNAWLKPYIDMNTALKKRNKN